MREPGIEIASPQGNIDQYRIAISARADMRRRELQFDRNIKNLTSQDDQNLSQEVREAHKSQHLLVVEALHGIETNKSARSENQINSYINQAEDCQDWAPNLAALYFAKAAQIRQSQGEDPTNLLKEATRFIDESNRQGIQKTTPGDFLPDAIVLGIEHKVIENSPLPNPEEAVKVIGDNHELLKDYALVLPEKQRSLFIASLPKEKRVSVSVKLDRALSEVLNQQSVHTEDESSQRDLVKYRVTKAFLRSLKQFPGNSDDVDRVSTKQIVETLTNLGGTDSARLLRSMSERTIKELKAANKQMKKKSPEEREKALKPFMSFTARVLDTLVETDESIRGGVLTMRFLEMTALPPRMFEHFCQKLVDKEYFAPELSDYLQDKRNIPVLKKLMGKYGTQFNTIVETLHQIPNYSLVDNELEIFAALSDLDTLTPRIYERYRSKNYEDRKAFASKIRTLKPQFFRNVPIKSILDRGDQDILAEMVYHAYKPVDMTYDKVADLLRSIPDCTEHLDGLQFPVDGYELNLTGPVTFTLEKGKTVDMSRLRQWRANLSGEREDREKPYAENFVDSLKSLAVGEKVGQEVNARNSAEDQLGVILSILNGEHRGQASFVQDFLDRFPSVNTQDAHGILQGIAEIYGVFFDDNFDQAVEENLRQDPKLSEGLTNLFADQEFRKALSEKMTTLGQQIDWTVFDRSLQFNKGLQRFLGNRGRETAQQFMAQTLTRFIKFGYIDQARKDIQGELGKFVQTNQEGQVVRHGALKLYVTKNAASFFAKASAGLCTKEQIDPFTDWENLFNLPIVENESVVRGMVEARLVDVAGKPSIVLRAINPNADWVDKVNIQSLWESVLKVAHQFARDNADKVTDNIYIVQHDDWHPLSNRAQVSSYLEQRYIKTKQGVNLNLQVAANHNIQKVYKV